MILNNPIIKNIGFMIGGASLGQFITICATPIITRLYQPEDFGALVFCLSVTGILGSLITLSYEQSIPLARNDEDANKILFLGGFIVLIQTIISIVCLLVLNLFYPESIIKLKGYLWFIPLIFFINGIYQLLYFWAVRINLFKLVAYIQFKQSVLKVVAQIIMGIAKTGSTGLLTGQLLNQGAGIVSIGRIVYKREKNLSFAHFSDYLILGKQFIKFPLYTCPATILNRSGIMVTPIIIVYLYGDFYAGLFGMVLRVISLPIVAVGRAISQVYYREACHSVSKDFSVFVKSYNTTLKWLFALAMAAILPGMICIYFAIPIVLGDQWYACQNYLLILSPMMLCQFTIGSMGQTLIILDKQDVQLFIDILRVSISCGSFLIAHKLNLSFENSLLLFSTGMCVCFLLLMYVIRYHIEKKIIGHNYQ